MTPTKIVPKIKMTSTKIIPKTKMTPDIMKTQRMPKQQSMR